jgi:hypothetical protein
MKRYELTFEKSHGDWTWIIVEAKDFHDAMLLALFHCPKGERVHKVMHVDLDVYPKMAEFPIADSDEFNRGRAYERDLHLEEAKRST